MAVSYADDKTEIEGLVERMLALHKKLAAATIPADKQLYQRQIEPTDRQIDALVYELYGLTNGGHNYPAWRDDVWQGLELLFGPS